MSLFDSLFRRPPIPTVTTEEVADKLRQGESYTLLDVREADEWEGGHIPGAIWIPLGELQQRLHELPNDREIVCVCRSGNRSAWATGLLAAHGYKASNMQGGMLNWSGDIERGK